MRFFEVLMRPQVARRLGTLATSGYLAETGWVRSVASRQIVDAKGEPVPWTTYPFIDFITPRLGRDWRVFEYGSGASTLFFARRVSRVLAVEHDEAFARSMEARLPVHAVVQIQREGSSEYADAVGSAGVTWQIVNVDGVDRVRCVAAALSHLDPAGVLVLDDAERAEYLPAVAQLRGAGFRVVEFWGLSPTRVERKCTSVFYRSENVLGL